MSCISRPKQPLGWGSPCHRLHMNSLRYSCYLLTIDQVSTDHRPSVDQLLTDTSVKYRRTIGEVSAKSRRSVGEVSVNEKLYRPRHIWNDYRPCLDRVLSDYRPSLDQLLTAILIESRLTIDRLLTECRPLFRLIDWSTLPTVNRIRSVKHTVGTIQSNLTISNSVNLKSPLFRRKIECPLIYPSPLRFPGYFEAPLFRTFFHFPWGFEIVRFDCII